MKHHVLGVDGEVENEKPQQRRGREPQLGLQVARLGTVIVEVGVDWVINQVTP